MRIRSLFVTVLIFSLLGLGTISCDKAIYENWEDCPRGVYVNFYSQTECAETPSYPAEVKRLNVYAFDDNNILRSTAIIAEPQLSETTEHLIPLPQKDGLYTVCAWANIDQNFNLENVRVGETTKSNLLFRLRQTEKLGADLTGTTLWYAESPKVLLGKMEHGAELYIHTRANLREYTNRVTVTIDKIGHPEDYDIKLASSNGSYLINGLVAKADSTYYPGETKVVADSTCNAFFTTLKLESGHESALIVTHKPTGKELFRTDLVGVILTSNYAENINLRCLNDFHVRLVARRCGYTFVIMEVWVNDWLVHSYDLEFE